MNAVDHSLSNCGREQAVIPDAHNVIDAQCTTSYYDGCLSQHSEPSCTRHAFPSRAWHICRGNGGLHTMQPFPAADVLVAVIHQHAIASRGRA